MYCYLSKRIVIYNNRELRRSLAHNRCSLNNSHYFFLKKIRAGLWNHTIIKYSLSISHGFCPMLGVWGTSENKTDKTYKAWRVLLWHSGLRIWHYHCSGLGCCCGADSVPGLGSFTCCGRGQKNKKIYKPCCHGTYMHTRARAHTHTHTHASKQTHNHK